jgi:hypothetical protein
MTPNRNLKNASSADLPAGLLVVTIDRLPAWMLAAYGATWVATPALDSLAARGIVFDRVLTPSTRPQDTLRALFAADLPEGRPLLAAAAAGGWRPAVVTDDPEVAAGVAADAAARVAADAAADTVAGSETSDCLIKLVEATAKTKVEGDDAHTNIAALADAALGVIAAGEHRLVWCHVGSLGVAWDAPERYRGRYVDPEDPPPPSGAGVPHFAVDADSDPDLVVGARQVFAGQLTLLDSQLARLFHAAQSAEAGGWSVLVVGVRGLPLGLHGWVGVGGRELPYGELIHVPAIFVDAAGRMAAQRYGGLVVPADLGRTLAEVVAQATGSLSREPAADPATPWLGVNLSGLFENWTAACRDRVVVAGPDGAAIVTPEWHCLLVEDSATSASVEGMEGHIPRVRLFAKPDDFFELADVANRCPGVAMPLEEIVKQASGGDGRAAWLARLPEVAAE